MIKKNLLTQNHVKSALQNFISIKEVARQLEDDLINSVLEPWCQHTSDQTYGGYQTAFDRYWNPTDKNKNVWMHARQVWTFSTAYEILKKEHKYKLLAEQGRDWLVSKAYAGHGHWNCLLSLKGDVLTGAESIFTDLFVLLGLSQYAYVFQTEKDLELIRQTFEAVNEAVRNDEYALLYPQTYKENTIIHGKYMIALNALGYALRVLRDSRIENLMAYCADTIFTRLYNGKNIYEIRTADGKSIDSVAGHMINPGHCLESMWFVLKESYLPEVGKYRCQALQVIQNVWQNTRDWEFGGLVHMLDDRGYTSFYKDWHPQRQLTAKEKVWWTNSGGLIALLYCAILNDDQQLWNDFSNLYNWCREHFMDKEYGEWYMVLNVDGTPRITDKGGLQKAAFHVPRALLLCHQLFKEIGI